MPPTTVSTTIITIAKDATLPTTPAPTTRIFLRRLITTATIEATLT